MFIEANAHGRDFRDVVNENAAGAKSWEIVFYYDGDEELGENNLATLSDLLQTVKEHPDLDALMILETRDSGREGVVLSFAQDPYEKLGIKAPTVEAEPEPEPKPGKEIKEAVEDLWEGKRFSATAKTKGNLGKPVDFVFLAVNPEKRYFIAMAIAEAKMHTPADNIDLTVRATDKEHVYRKTIADIQLDRYVDEKIIKSDPRIAQFLKKRQDAQQRRGFRR